MKIEPKSKKYSKPVRNIYFKFQLCISCGAEKDDKQYNRCKACREKEAERMRKKYKERREAGLCNCGKVPLPRLRSCKKCIDRATNRNKFNTANGFCSCGNMLDDPEHYKTCLRCRTRELSKYEPKKEETVILRSAGSTLRPRLYSAEIIANAKRARENKKS